MVFCSSEGSQSHVTIAISDYTLAVVFGSQKEVWTTDIRVFDTLTTISSAGFTKAKLNTAIVTSAVFETLEVSQGTFTNVQYTRSFSYSFRHTYYT